MENKKLTEQELLKVTGGKKQSATTGDCTKYSNDHDGKEACKKDTKCEWNFFLYQITVNDTACTNK